MTRLARKLSLLLTMALPLMLTLLATGCSAAGSGQTTLRVFAASSLTDAIEEAARAFESERESVSIEVHYAGSALLRAQLEQGAQADVFLAADWPQMDAAADAGLLSGDAIVFASNEIVVALADSGRSINGLADLARPGLQLVIALPQTPAGAYAREALAALDSMPGFGVTYSQAVLDNIVSEETNVRSVLAKVSLGEADAGFVYQTDARGAQLEALQFPSDAQAEIAYTAAVLAGAQDPSVAQEFLSHLLSARGQEILRQHGFQPPAQSSRPNDPTRATSGARR